MNSEIAELCGIITGDGHLSRNISEISSRKNNYRIDIAANKTEEVDYFKHISHLFKKIFSKEIKIKIKKNYANLYIHSKEILEFFENIGIIVGKKSRQAFIPKKILNDKKLALDFLRGLADTDFSMTFKKGGRKNNSYPRIAASSASLKLINDIQIILKRKGLTYYSYKVIKNSSFGIFDHYRIDINGRSNFKKWMDLIGFNNPKHTTKIKIWEKFGYCPPNTTYSERLEMLKEDSCLPS